MKAWEFARNMLETAEPIIRSEEEQTWDASAPMHALDFVTTLFWKSNVPGSGAPECLMAAALQSLENKGYIVGDYEAQLNRGLAAVASGDMEALYKVDRALRAQMRTARPDPAHKSQRTARFASWEAFDAVTSWPADVAVDVKAPDFADRIEAGWMAQLVGAAVGTALEGYTAANLARVFGPITSYPRPPNTYNDDITFELAFLEAFSRAGYAVTSTDIAAEWTALIPMGWSAEAVALANIRRGVEPPHTGIEDNPFDEWIGAQMRGVICGMVAPGRAREAARLAWLDGQVSHTSNGILGEVFNAVLAALAFGGGDMRPLVESAVALMPPASEYGMVVRNALAACKASDDWQSAWANCDAELIEYNWIHVYPNAAAQIIALWFGGDDFDRTLAIIGGIGHDVDCNAAQILCVLAIARGNSSIGAKWRDPIGARIVTYMRRPAEIGFAELVDQTVQATIRATDQASR